MDFELLDVLEEKVDIAVSTVNDLKVENELLKEDKTGLEEKLAKLSSDLETAGQSREQVESLQARCTELEEKLAGVRGRVEAIVTKMKTLEG